MVIGPKNIDDEDLIMLLFDLSFEGNAKRWYFSLPLGSIDDYEIFEDTFKKIWSFNVKGVFNLEKIYHMKKKGNEYVREFIQTFNRIFRDILDHLKPLYSLIIYKLTKVVGWHITYQLKDKNPKKLAKAKEIVIEVEKNINAYKSICLNILGLR